MHDNKSLLDIAREATKKAGIYLMGGFRTDPLLTSPPNKNNRSSLFTEYDKGSNEILTNLLVEGFLSSSYDKTVYIYSEESGFSKYHKSKNGSIVNTNIENPAELPEQSFTWIIDPICGSIPFARGISDFIVSVALMQAETLLLGVVYDPAQDEQFYASKGNGSFLNENPIQPSDTDILEEAYTSIEHKVFRVAPPQDIQNLTKKIRRLRVAGTCGLEMAYVACGRLDGLIKLNQPIYDYAAGLIILNETPTVKCTSLDGKRATSPNLNANIDTSFLASNGRLHSKFIIHIQQWPLTFTESEDI